MIVGPRIVHRADVNPILTGDQPRECISFRLPGSPRDKRNGSRERDFITVGLWPGLPDVRARDIGFRWKREFDLNRGRRNESKIDGCHRARRHDRLEMFPVRGNLWGVVVAFSRDFKPVFILARRLKPEGSPGSGLNVENGIPRVPPIGRDFDIKSVPKPDFFANGNHRRLGCGGIEVFGLHGHDIRREVHRHFIVRYTRGVAVASGYSYLAAVGRVIGHLDKIVVGVKRHAPRVRMIDCIDKRVIDAIPGGFNRAVPIQVDDRHGDAPKAARVIPPIRTGRKRKQIDRQAFAYLSLNRAINSAAPLRGKRASQEGYEVYVAHRVIGFDNRFNRRRPGPV